MNRRHISYDHMGGLKALLWWCEEDQVRDGTDESNQMVHAWKWPSQRCRDASIQFVLFLPAPAHPNDPGVALTGFWGGFM